MVCSSDCSMYNQHLLNDRSTDIFLRIVEDSIVISGNVIVHARFNLFLMPEHIDVAILT